MIRIRFSREDYREALAYYTEKQIRQILYEGAIGELRLLVSNKEENTENEDIAGEDTLTVWDFT